jgi:hypothetical protein
MRTRSLSLTTVFGFLGLIMLVHSFQSFAAPGKIECETAFGEKKFTIEEGRVAFQKEDESGVARSISSVKGHAVRTHKKHLGFSKSMYIDGLKYRINVKNAEAFSEVEDYLSITSPKGHEMTYPLTFHSV